MRETEYKLSVHASFMVPDLGSTDLPYRLEEGPVHDLRSTYYDTEDLRLARSGATLRYRSGEEGDPWTLKLPVEGLDLHVREEHTFAGGPTSIPEQARDLTTAWVRTEELKQVARLTSKRRVWLIKDEENEIVAEIDDDEVSILEGRRVVARFREVEIESKGLAGKELLRIRDMLLDAGAVGAEPIPKAVRALGPRATAESDIPTAPEVDPDDPASKAVTAAIVSGVNRIVSHDAPTRLGDVEGLHQMRVGARRLRSDLKTFGPLVNDEWADTLINELKWIADVLGEVRDLDVLLQRLRNEAGRLGDSFGELFASLAERHSAARKAMDEALKSERYKTMLERLVNACHEPAFTEKAQERCREVLPGLVEDAWKKLEKKGRALEPHSPEEDFHQVRIKAKKTRYAGEAVAAALGKAGKDTANFAALAEAVQDVLGVAQDTAVSRTIFEDFARHNREDGALNFALGRLYEREEQEAQRMRQRFFEVWDELDRKKHRKWMSS